MAAKKKAKAKKKKKATKKKSVTRKRVTRKPKRAAAARPKKKAKKKAAPVKKPKAVKTTAPPPAVVPPNEERIGVVTHYYTHLGVAVVQLEAGVLRDGDTVHIKGHTSDFMQPIGSMEIDHVHVGEARAGQSFGLKVKEHAREHDVVYRVKRM